MTKKTSDLHFRMFDTRWPGADRAACEAAYLLYKNQWEKTYAELGVAKKLHSDDFLNRRCMAFYEGRECVGLLLADWFDLASATHVDHSYFSSYPAPLLEFIKSLGHTEVMNLGGFTIAPEWRKSVTDLALSDLLVGMGMRIFLASHATGVLTCMRNNRSVNDVVYSFGGRKLATGRAFNVEVDYGLTSRDSAKDHPDPAVTAALDRLWSSGSTIKEKAA